MPRGVKGSGKKAVVKKTGVRLGSPKVSYDRGEARFHVDFWDKVKQQAQLIEIMEGHFIKIIADLSNFDKDAKCNWGSTLASKLTQTASEVIKGLDLMAPGGIKTVWTAKTPKKTVKNGVVSQDIVTTVHSIKEEVK